MARREYLTADDITQVIKSLLVKAAQQAGRKWVTAEEIVVALWTKYPDRFAMEGFRQYPDSHRVMSMLMGKKGLVGRGSLERIGPRKYALPVV